MHKHLKMYQSEIIKYYRNATKWRSKKYHELLYLKCFNYKINEPDIVWSLYSPANMLSFYR